MWHLLERHLLRAHFRVPLYSMPHFSLVSTSGPSQAESSHLSHGASLPVRSFKKGLGFTGTVAMVPDSPSKQLAAARESQV